jgi:hypothetical protein
MRNRTILSILMSVLCFAGVSGAATCTGGIWPGDINKDCYVNFDDFAMLAANWMKTNTGTGAPVLITSPIPSGGATIHVEAENCTLGGSYYSSGGVVYVAGTPGVANSFQSNSGNATFQFPNAIPDGTYFLKVHWSVGNTFSGGITDAYMIGAASGSSAKIYENGATSQGGWHTFYPHIDSDTATDYLAGTDPNFNIGPIWTGAPKASYLTLQGVGANQFQVTIWDQSALNYAYIGVDYFELVPVSAPIKIEAENCILADATGADGGYYLIWTPGWQSGASVVSFAADSSGNVQSAKGQIKISLPMAIPDGTYYLGVHWKANNTFVGSSQYAYLLNTSQGSLVENGISNQGGWHTYYPNKSATVADDYLAGPDPNFNIGPIWTGSPKASSITVSNIGAGDFNIYLWDMSAANYDYMDVDYFTLTPVTIPGQPLHWEAENCTLGGDYCPLNITNDGWVYFASTKDGSDGWFQSYQGIATFTIPDPIPDGQYQVRVHWKQGNYFAGNTYAYMIAPEPNTGGTVVENDIANQGGWHTFYPNCQAQDKVDYLTGTDPNLLIGPIWSGSPKATSITTANVGPNGLRLSMWDECPLNYDYMALDWIELVPKYDVTGDIDNSNAVDFKDLKMMADEWLKCNDSSNPLCRDIICSDPGALGITAYTAYPVSGTVTLDGNLTEWPAFDYNPTSWCASHWVPLAKVYDGSLNTTPGQGDIENVFLCLMYDGSANVLYGAVIADDYDGSYFNCSSTYAWDGQDDLEIYVQGNRDNTTPTSPYGTWANGQQFVLGLCSDFTTTYELWPDGVIVGGHTGETDCGFRGVVKRTTGADYLEHMVYEFKVVPYDNYGGLNSTTTVQTDLYSGKQIGFDVVLSVSSPDDSFYPYGMLCPNLLTGKAYNVTKYATVTCQ